MAPTTTAPMLSSVCGSWLHLGCFSMSWQLQESWRAKDKRGGDASRHVEHVHRGCLDRNHCRSRGVLQLMHPSCQRSFVMTCLQRLCSVTFLRESWPAGIPRHEFVLQIHNNWRLTSLTGVKHPGQVNAHGPQSIFAWSMLSPVCRPANALSRRDSSRSPWNGPNPPKMAGFSCRDVQSAMMRQTAPSLGGFFNFRQIARLHFCIGSALIAWRMRPPLAESQMTTMAA